jgi:hypothetical protein
MSNIAAIYLTKFSDLDAKLNETKVSYGIRVADDYDSTYTNLMQKEELSNWSPIEILEIAKNIDDKASAIIGAAQENQDGIEIASVFYSWEELDVDVSKIKTLD